MIQAHMGRIIRRADMTRAAASHYWNVTCPLKYEQLPHGCASNVIPADAVLHTANGVQHACSAGDYMPHAPPCCATRIELQSDPRATDKPLLQWADVAVGMSLAASWVDEREPGTSRMNDRSLCTSGFPLACARLTWMASAGPSLQVIGLVDCRGMCTGARKRLWKLPAAQHLCGRHGRRTRHMRSSHGIFDGAFRRPKSLAPRPQMAELRLHCFWLPYSGLGLSYLKTTALLQVLLSELPSKRFYLKVDADTVLRPQHLLPFLRRVHRVREDIPIYFGSALGSPNCKHSDGKYIGNYECGHAHSFREGTPRRSTSWRYGVSVQQRIRSSPGWKELRHSVRNMINKRVVPSIKTPLRGWDHEDVVTYAYGGAYGLSHRALELLVLTNCTHRLGALKCFDERRAEGNSSGFMQCELQEESKEIQTHEDVNIGLCMNLIGAQLLQCDCFHNKPPLYWEKYLGHGHLTGSALPPSLRNLSTSSAGLEKRVELVLSTFAAAKPRFGEYIGMTHRLPRGAAWLCRHPIALHPVKERREMLDWWHVLDAWDAHFANGSHHPHRRGVVEWHPTRY